MTTDTTLRECFRTPIPQIYDVARYMDAAVSAHLAGMCGIAGELFRLANNSEVRAWLESIWGKNSLYVRVTKLPPSLIQPVDKQRLATAMQVRELHERDGYHCRFCSIPVVRVEVRKRALSLYPEAVTWGSTNASQHAGFQTLWAQYDHVVPHSRGGTNTVDNLIVTCAACNYGKMNYSLEEVGLLDPRLRPPVKTTWDGLERLLRT